MSASTARKPLIAVFPRLEERANNNGMAVLCQAEAMEAIQRCGGIPVIIPPVSDPADLAEYVERFDGFFVPGGVPDLDPSLYGEERIPECGPRDEVRDAFETALIPLVVAADKPIMGICRGCQAINVSLGGTLWQDLPVQVQARMPEDAPRIGHLQPRPFEPASHTANVLGGTLVARVFGLGGEGGELAVNSVHHQSVKELAPGLAASAFAPDGIVEGIEMPGKRHVVGYQWHPEMMWATREEQLAPFAALVEAARG